MVSIIKRSWATSAGSQDDKSRNMQIVLQDHLCCVSLLAARRFEGALKYRVWVEEGQTSSFLPDFCTVSFPLFFLKTILSCQTSIPCNVDDRFYHKMIKAAIQFHCLRK